MHGETIGNCRWNLRDVLIAGRRYDGTANGRTPEEAVRHFAAVKARELGAEVATAVATATRDRLKKIELREDAA